MTNNKFIIKIITVSIMSMILLGILSTPAFAYTMNSNKFDSNRNRTIFNNYIDDTNEKIKFSTINNFDLSNELKDLNFDNLINNESENYKMSFPGFGPGSKNTLPVEPEIITMKSKLATDFAGADYEVKLSSNIYMHVDENGNEDSNKWAFLIHPFTQSGSKMANVVGPFYYERGYNIIAPDLRAAGGSEGEVALGFVESMDMYDWLQYLDSNYEFNEVVVHGISLGAATTNYLSGLDKMIEDGPIKLGYELKSLEDFKVKALVEDCGYTNMEQFQSKEQLVKRKLGFGIEHFEYYSQSTNSLKYNYIPMLVIHGTKDFMVKPENAQTVIDTVRGPVVFYEIQGGQHADVIMGGNKEAYKENLYAFLDKYVEDVEVPDVPVDPEVPEEPDVPVEPEDPEIPEEPEKPEKPDIPNLPDLPDLPELPKLPDIPEIPELPNIPGIPEDGIVDPGYSGTFRKMYYEYWQRTIEKIKEYKDKHENRPGRLPGWLKGNAQDDILNENISIEEIEFYN